MTPETTQRLQRLTQLTAEISQAGRYHVFFSVFGHIPGCSLYVHPAGYLYYEGEERKRVIDRSIRLSESDANQRLDGAIQALESLQ